MAGPLLFFREIYMLFYRGNTLKYFIGDVLHGD